MQNGPPKSSPKQCLLFLPRHTEQMSLVHLYLQPPFFECGGLVEGLGVGADVGFGFVTIILSVCVKALFISYNLKKYWQYDTLTLLIIYSLLFVSKIK